MFWLDKILAPKIKSKANKMDIPAGLWVKCSSCGETLYKENLIANLYVCTKCDYHNYISARCRIKSLLDSESVQIEIAKQVKPVDTLKFKDTKKYADRLIQATSTSQEDDALISIKGKLGGMEVILAVFEFKFIGGSMGSVVGEKFVRSVKEAVSSHCPFICITCSGGARMQEGLLSLLQMAKTSASLHLLSDEKLPFISILTNPTTGGVSASFSFLGDIIIAEPKALIGFAGPRVIEQTVKQKLPTGFQSSEFLLEKGAIDLVVDRRNLKEKLINILLLFNF